MDTAQSNSPKVTYNERGEIHCEDGPAIVGPGGYESWWRNGALHREDGPAVIWRDDDIAITNSWWLNGRSFAFTEWADELGLDPQFRLELMLKWSSI